MSRLSVNGPFLHSDWYKWPRMRKGKQHISVKWLNVFFSLYW